MMGPSLNLVHKLIKRRIYFNVAEVEHFLMKWEQFIQQLCHY